jgi:hypothetical protein
MVEITNPDALFLLTISYAGSAGLMGVTMNTDREYLDLLGVH